MKKSLCIVIFISIITGCKTNEESKSDLKKSQLIGDVILKKHKRNQQNELFFRITDTDYFIKFSEGYVSKDKVLKYENQTIKIKGEIKNGPWEPKEPEAFGKPSPPKPRQGKYVVIYKLYN